MIQRLFYIFLMPVLVYSGCSKKTADSSWQITSDEYLASQGFNVLVFHDYYPEGYQGGIEFIHHEERISSNGYINVSVPRGPGFPRPAKAERKINAERNEIIAGVSVPEFSFNYNIRIWPEGGSVHVVVDLEKPIPDEWKGRASFDMLLY